MGDSYIRLTSEGTSPSRSREDVGFFFINNFLLSRIDSNFPSDFAGYDEDVNVYTAALLAGVASGREDLLRGDLVFPRDADVFARVQESTDQRLRYRVYKANADFLYVSLGLFHDGSAIEDEPIDPQDEHASRLAGRGKSYYNFASAYAERLYGPRAGIAEVMGKLGRNFEAYARVMSWMGTEYLNFVRRLSEGEVFHLGRDAQRRYESARRDHAWDELLDSYLDWQRTHARESRRRLVRAVRALRRVHPDFSLKAFRDRWSKPPRA